MRFSIISLFICLLWANAALACSESDFEVSGIHSRIVSGRIIFMGEVTNNCAEAAAVVIRATAYAEDGSVIGSEEYMPSGQRNIEPGARQPFSHFMNIDRKVEKLTVVPASVHKW